MSIAENIALLRGQIALAAAKAGRTADEIELIAVSKYQPVEAMREALDAGIRTFGENHAQELNEKKTFFELHGCRVHFIGQLQTNKIKYVCGFVDLIESVDRETLANQLNQKAETRGVVQDILIQVNIGAEEQKGGVTDGDLDCFADSLLQYRNLRLRGLMCVPPALEAEQTRPYFRRMRQIYERLNKRLEIELFDTLSMGMSHDFSVAIEEGATQVRVGTRVFGARDRL